MAAERKRRLGSGFSEEEKLSELLANDPTHLYHQVVNSIIGHGLFTHEKIPRRTPICVYTRNPMVPAVECQSEVNHADYLYYFKSKGVQMCYDAYDPEHGIGRWANDEWRNPTCEMKKKAVGGVDYLFLYSKEEIQPKSELRYDYGDSSAPWRKMMSRRKLRKMNSEQSVIEEDENPFDLSDWSPAQEKDDRSRIQQEVELHEKPKKKKRYTAAEILKAVVGKDHKDEDKCKERRKKLDDREEEEKFKEAANDLNSWVTDIRGKLKEKETPHDVAEAEALLKKHAELLEDINSNRDRFALVEELGRQILAQNSDAPGVREMLDQLAREQKQLDELWQKRNEDLKNAAKLQAFLKEADHIDAGSTGHLALLNYNELGLTPEEAEALHRNHQEFLNKLAAQDEKVKALNDLADRLIREGHPDALIDARRKEVNAKRDKIKEKAAKRAAQLEDSQNFQEFQRDADKLSDWMKDKYKIATDPTWKDLTNLLPKLQKHQAFEAELAANKDRLDKINQDADTMTSQRHYASPEIKSTQTQFNADWKDLNDKTQDKGQKLRQATRQELLNKALADANAKLAEMERLVSSDDVGKDLRGVKDLLSKHQMLEKDMDANALNLKAIVEQGEQMASDKHFDSAGVLKAVQDFEKRHNALKDPIAKRRQKLEDSLRWHQFNFDADEKLNWIKEHKPAATSTEYGKNLVDAQNLAANHKVILMNEVSCQVVPHSPSTLLSTGSVMHKAIPSTLSLSSHVSSHLPSQSKTFLKHNIDDGMERVLEEMDFEQRFEELPQFIPDVSKTGTPLPKCPRENVYRKKRKLSIDTHAGELDKDDVASTQIACSSEAAQLTHRSAKFEDQHLFGSNFNLEHASGQMATLSKSALDDYISEHEIDDDDDDDDDDDPDYFPENDLSSEADDLDDLSNTKNSNEEEHDSDPDYEQGSDIFPVLTPAPYRFEGTAKNSTGNLVNKRHSCLFCYKMYPNIARHIEFMHSEEIRVAKILAMKKKSAERRKAWDELIKEELIADEGEGSDDDADDNDDDDDDAAGDVEEEQQADAEIKVPAKKKKAAATVTRSRWSQLEMEDVRAYFHNSLRQQKVPGKLHCDNCIANSQHLERRSWKEVKYCVKNMISKARKQIAKL